MKEKYLVYIDMLGFTARAKKETQKTDLTSEEIIETYRNRIKEKLANLIGKNIIETFSREDLRDILYSHEISKDSWLFIVENINNLYRSIGEILETKLPLEIYIGIKELEDLPSVKGLFSLKEEIVSHIKWASYLCPYRNLYKIKNGKSIKKTFIVLTKDVFDQLSPLDRKKCKEFNYQKIKYYEGDEFETFYEFLLPKFRNKVKVIKFLSRKGMGLQNSAKFNRIDEIYIPPLEYNDLKSSLMENRVLFITGSPEYGKTYTAMRLLWEYYLRGYEPVYIPGREKGERERVRGKLEEIESELKPHHVIYFEDPFGIIEYESREYIERDIEVILSCVNNVEDVYVILTSREEVFKEFEKEQLSSLDLNKFEKKLNLKKPSYDDKKRKEILLKWAEAVNCKWLKHQRLKNIILKYIKTQKYLPTLLSIKDFTTSTIHVKDERTLIYEIIEKSKLTAKTFAKEIKQMSNDKVLFLSFPLIYPLKINIVKTEYEKLVKKLDIREPWEFEQILTWFEDTKINITQGRLSFSHSSYSEAIEHLLVDRGTFTRINKEIISKLIIQIARDYKLDQENIPWAVANIVAYYYDYFPDNVRNLLFKFAEREVTARPLSKIIISYYNFLPQKVRDLLFKLEERNLVTYELISNISLNFNRLPPKVRNLLFKYADKEEGARPLIYAISRDFKYLPHKVQNLLLKFAEEEKTIIPVVHALARHFQPWASVIHLNPWPMKFCTELMLKLAEKNKSAPYIANILADKLCFEAIPEKIRNNLVLTLAEKDSTKTFMYYQFYRKLNDFPSDIRSELMLKFKKMK